MHTFADLYLIAYKKERACSRRLAKNLGLSKETALRQTLEAASDDSLSELIAQRQQKQAEAIASTLLRKQKKSAALAYKAAAAQPDPTAWLAWFDGSSHPNPGKMGIGGVLKNPNGDMINISFSGGQGDSSAAEYLALIAVLQAAVRAHIPKLLIYGDSRVVLDDVQTKQGGARILSTQRMQAQQLIAQLDDVSFTWIPRRKNAMADALSQQAAKLPPAHEPP